MEEAGSVANPLADQQGDFRWLGDESGRLATAHHRSDGLALELPMPKGVSASAEEEANNERDV